MRRSERKIQIVERSFQFSGRGINEKLRMRRGGERDLSRTAHANLIAPPFLRGRNKCRPVTRSRYVYVTGLSPCSAWSSAHVSASNTRPNVSQNFYISRRKLFPISFIYFPAFLLDTFLSFFFFLSWRSQVRNSRSENLTIEIIL